MMGWIKFDYDCGDASLWYETSSEDGWTFNFNDYDKTFRVWESAESKAMDSEPDYICRNLNEVLDRIKTFT